MLLDTYKACGTNVVRAAAKMHLVMSITGMGPRSLRITAERSADCRNLNVGKWVANRLLLFDLGYFSCHLFDRIARNLGFFVTRAKSAINPRVVAVNRCWRADRSIVGQRLQEVLGTLQRGVLDVMVEVEFKRRIYRGKQSSGVRVFRLVGLLNQDTGEYHLYMSSIPPERLDADDIARVYRARWEVELIFKELKSHYRLDRLPSTKAHIVEALIYTAIRTRGHRTWSPSCWSRIRGCPGGWRRGGVGARFPASRGPGRSRIAHWMSLWSLPWPWVDSPPSRRNEGCSLGLEPVGDRILDESGLVVPIPLQRLPDQPPHPR